MTSSHCDEIARRAARRDYVLVGPNANAWNALILVRILQDEPMRQASWGSGKRRSANYGDMTDPAADTDRKRGRHLLARSSRWAGAAIPFGQQVLASWEVDQDKTLVDQVERIFLQACSQGVSLDDPYIAQPASRNLGTRHLREARLPFKPDDFSLYYDPTGAV
jgi:hypothetical protein